MRWIPGLLGVACLVAASCAPAPAAPTAPAAGAQKSNFNAQTTLNLRLDGPWDSFDPSSSANLPSTQLQAVVYDRLVYFSPDKQIQPYLATAWEQNGNSLKFTLRKNVTCNDGTPLTPSIVAKSFDRTLGITDPKSKSTLVAGEFGPGPFTVSADDAAGTFTLTLGSPWGEALKSVATGGDSYIICPKGFEAGALKDAAYGTGPYVIDSADRATGITLKLRSDWAWGPNGRTAEGMPGQLAYKIITNDTTAANLLLTGGLDIARVQGPDVQRLLSNSSLGQLKATAWYTNPLWINPSEGHATADPAVRQAIFTAVSADEWVKAAYGGQGTVTTSWFATNAPCFNPDTAQYIPKTDLAAAKQVLLNAGYTADASGKLSKNGTPLALTVVGETPQAPGPEYIQTQLTQLGMTVDFVNTDHVTYSSSYLQPGKFDVIVPGIASDVLGSWVAFMSGPPPPTGRNFSRIQDAALDEQIANALKDDPEKACGAWKDIQIAWLKGYYARPLAAQNFWWFSRNPAWKFYATTTTLQPYTLN